MEKVISTLISLRKDTGSVTENIAKTALPAFMRHTDFQHLDDDKWSESTICQPRFKRKNPHGRLREFAESRPLFKDDPAKYTGMDPMEACDELGISLAQLVEYVNAEEDLYPNPRRLYHTAQGAARRATPREPVTTRPAPVFNISVQSPGGVALGGKKIGENGLIAGPSPGGVVRGGMKIGENGRGAEVSATEFFSHSHPFHFLPQHQHNTYPPHPHHLPLATSPLYPVTHRHSRCLNSWLLQFIFPAIYHSFGKSVSSLACTTTSSPPNTTLQSLQAFTKRLDTLLLIKHTRFAVLESRLFCIFISHPEQSSPR
jgi:hypothetical protein